MNDRPGKLAPTCCPTASSECDHDRRVSKPTERAFVVQFDAPATARTRLRGRVEVVASGEALRFRSVKELIAFMVRVVRRRGSKPRR